nr:unnamed protein product [Spirometra erinaceieuropaei]
MQKFGCPERFTQLERWLYDGMMPRVTDSGHVSEAFAVTTRVKQGCVLASILFILMFSVMLMNVHRDERPGIRVAYRTDGRLVNQWRTHFQSRVSAASFHELHFVVDCALNATSEGDVQRSMDIFAIACDNFDLAINTEKTVFLHQSPPDAACVPPQINVNDVQMQAVDNFTYVSSTLSRNTKIDDDVAHRIFKAS